MRSVRAATPGIAFRFAIAATISSGFSVMSARAQQPPPAIPQQVRADASRVPTQSSPANQYSSDEIIDAGHHFFGSVSKGIASVVENATRQWGLPNGYVLGEEAGGAFIGGLRYGDGTLYTKNAGDRRVYWQGPSLRLRRWCRRCKDHDVGL